MRGGHRPRRILRASPGAAAVRAAVSRRPARADSGRGKPERDALALRRAGLHGVGHAGPEVDAGRMAEPLPRREGNVRGVRVRRGVAVPRGRDDAADAAHPRRSGRRSRHEFARRVHGARRRQRRPSGSRRCTGPAKLTWCTARGARCSTPSSMLQSANPQRYQPENGADYPRSQFGQRLREIAQLIKSGVGIEVAFADVGGWDTHVNQGAANRSARGPTHGLLALGRRAGHRPRRPDERRRHPLDVGVRPHGAPERERRH